MTEDTQILVETGAKEEIGIVDEPLEKRGEDSLKIKKYSNALVTFIKNSLTPMTIGIQGSWGSGKTSLLNTIYAQLDDANEHVDSKDFKVIWINSWENSLMATPEEALIKIINEIINGLNEVDPSLTNIQKVKDAATVAAKGILRVGAGILGGQAGSEVVTEVLESTNSIKQLREQLSQLVNAIRESNSQRVDKIVIFVDDLDRVDPPEAVKILELLKNIFNIPGCIFVLAIDYDVVIKGLKDKFGERTPENEYEFRAFFDKIIQLPFLMPVQNYDIGNYVNDLLRKIGFQDENIIDTEFVNQVVDNTIGGNPRTIKRLINSLALIKIVNDEDEDGDEQEEEIASDEELLIERKLLFALVCLQIASSDIYSLLNKESDFKKWDENLAFSITQKKEEEDEKFEQNFASLTSENLFDDIWEQALYRVCYANPKERANAIKLSKFLNYLHEDLGSNSKYPLPSMIEKALGKTSVTSVVTDSAERAPKGSYKRNYAKGFDGWLEEIKTRTGSLPEKDIIDKLKMIVDVWMGPKFNAVDWVQGEPTPDGFNIRYAGGAALYIGGKKLGIAYPHHQKQRNEQGIAIQSLKNPERNNQIVQIGKMKFRHSRPILIDRDEKKILKGTPGLSEWMWCDIGTDDLQNIKSEYIELLYTEGAKVRTEMADRMLKGKFVRNYVDAFKNGRKDSKAWVEAADFLEEHFDEKNIVTIDL
tara:strand:+ start:38201 stop:40315 length:2115 start_codon:yes stop_codon:yes gene_type:complete